MEYDIIYNKVQKQANSKNKEVMDKYICIKIIF